MIEITYDSEKGFQTKHTIEDKILVGAAIEAIESFKNYYENYYENQIELYKEEIRRLEKENKELKKAKKELEDFKFMYDSLCK